jgi:hypothetical protein
MGIDFASLYEFCIGFSSRLDSVVGFLFGFFSFYYNFTEQYDYYLDKKSPTTIPGADPRGKIMIFHTKHPKNFRVSLRSAQFF